MPEPIVEPKVEVAPIVDNQPKTEVATPKEDLISRVSKVEVKPKEETNTFGLTKEDWDKVQSDPTLKKYYDSMHSDYQKKTQMIAETRKEYEHKQQEQAQWSPEKISQLLKDDNFVKAAAQVVQTQAPKGWNGTDEKWSNLSETEKQEFLNMQDRLKQLENQNYLSFKIQQDQSLKGKYANYNPNAVDILTADMLAGKVQATREHLWKAMDYEDAVKRAYELGIKDGKAEPLGGTYLPSGVQTQPAGEKVEPIKGETDRAYFKRLAEKRLAEAVQQRK